MGLLQIALVVEMEGWVLVPELSPPVEGKILKNKTEFPHLVRVRKQTYITVTI